MNGSLLQVTWAGANEQRLSLWVTSDSDHSKFHVPVVLREPGLSDGPWRHTARPGPGYESQSDLRVEPASEAGHRPAVRS